MAEGRPAGWYPDPWGTDGERYFDGAAWGRESRPVGGDPAITPDSAVPESGATVPTAPPPPTGAGADPEREAVPTAATPGAAPTVTPGAPPAGWHPDPWGLAAVRWWDGTAWTGYVSGPPGAPGAPARVADVAGERGLARWAGPALVLGGIAAAVNQVSLVDQAVWMADNWDALSRPSGTVPEPPVTLATSLGQLTSIITIGVGIAFLLWFYRAASNAWAAGLPARRGPVLAMLSFLIPIVNLWWPYQSTLDMVPADDPRRKLIGYWWATWLFGMLCGLLVLVAAFTSGRTLAQVVAVIGGVAMVAAGLLARSVVDYVTAVHETRIGDVPAGR